MWKQIGGFGFGPRGFGALAALAFSSLLASPLPANAATRGAWKVTKAVDPITGESSCVVTAADHVGSSFFTRTGILYPLVENSSRFGLLVGVSSGGPYRLPTGDILWRVDQQSFRELKAADNPGLADVPVADNLAAQMPSKDGLAAQTIKDAVAQTTRLTASVTATSTLASGDTAKAMLAEMLVGKGLIYRTATAAAAYGLPNTRASMVGQMTYNGLKPVPIDDSFRAGLQACGISLP